MKRKETLFEQKLIEKGWKLTHKGYDLKTSQKIDSYHYTKMFNFCDVSIIFRVMLDNKREKIKNLYFFPQFVIAIDRETMELINKAFNLVEKELASIYLSSHINNKEDEDNSNELVETLEAIEECE